MATNRSARCAHCRSYATIRARNLCSACYYTLAIRSGYPAQVQTAVLRAPASWGEPTAVLPGPGRVSILALRAGSVNIFNRDDAQPYEMEPPRWISAGVHLAAPDGGLRFEAWVYHSPSKHSRRLGRYFDSREARASIDQFLAQQDLVPRSE